MNTPANPNVDYTKEVRFAVVMYGGVSLAIYINGVAQELLRMVKSTAPADDNEISARALPTKDGTACGTEAVYRKLSYLIDDPASRTAFREALASGAKSESLQSNDPIRVRFMVDVLAGTSAGGINSIYLSKALANDQNIDELKNLWITEGDINVLINDNDSLENTSLRAQRPPKSLLNSRRMYLKLLAALDGMDRPTAARRSPLVDELDLYITATDIRGLSLPIRLADRVVYERRHRNVFHFKYATAEATGSAVNEFRPELNPFLAFAARTTSSFPFAFEPVRLADIRELLEHSEVHRGAKDNFKPDSPLIRRYFLDNITSDTDAKSVDYDLRSFADGGYLDNKPFTYATSTLTRRSPKVPVDRKLIYIEPSPEHPEREIQPTDPPDAIENVLAALDLPRYETIREDIEAVLGRNRLIDRVNRITSEIEDDIERYSAKQDLSDAAKAVLAKEAETRGKQPQQLDVRPARQEISPKLWDVLGLSDMVGLYGMYYLPYRRLRVSALTDEISRLTARVAGFDERSDMFLAIRALVTAWRDDTYSVEASEDGQTLNGFLNKFDLAYRLRRLNFLVGKIDELLCLLDLRAKKPEMSSSLANRLVTRLNKAGEFLNFTFDELSEEQRAQAYDFLLYLKCELNQLYIELRKFGRDLRRPPVRDGKPSTPVTAQTKDDRYQAITDYKTMVGQLGLTGDHLRLILGAKPGDNRYRPIEIDQEDADCLRHDEPILRAQRLLEQADDYSVPGLKGRFADTGKYLEEVMASVLKPTSNRTRNLLDPTSEVYEQNPRCVELPGAAHMTSSFGVTIRRYLGEYFRHFDDYDQISFPIYFETDVGESDIVEVIRISPEDAPSLIDEKNDARSRKKLAGTRLANFSAFLDAAWRVNDIMWGRLDGAERLITALLPNDKDEDIRKALIREAHEAILAEELSPAAQADLASLLGQALVQRSAGLKIADAIERILKPIDSEVVKKRLTSVMTTCLEGDALYSFMRDYYEVDRSFEPEMTLRVLGRATRVIGNILDDISKARNVENKLTPWISRVGQIFLGLVEVAVPESLWALLFRHWLKLLYFFEFILIVLATFVLSTPGVASFAWKLLALTVGVNFAVFLLRDYMRGRNVWQRIGILILILGVIFLAAIGFGDLLNRGWSGRVLSAWHWVSGFVAATRSWIRGLF